MQQLYNDFSHWIRRQFPFRVQKISVDAGFSCPNQTGGWEREDVSIVIMRPLVRHTVTGGKVLQSSLKMERCSLQENIQI